MKYIYHYLISFLLMSVLLAMAAWVGYGIADACNACLNRVHHAAMVRTKMRQCVQQKYTDFPQCEEPDGYMENEVAWSPVTSECYGPQRQVRKKKSVSSGAKKGTRKRTARTIMPSPDDHKDLLTHRTAPFSLPLPAGSFWLSSRFGPRPRPDGSAGFHHGIDLAANKGTRVYAARSGIVLYAGYDNGYGKTIVIKHGTHFKTRYAHLDRISVHTGDTVIRGATIGAVGSTGHVRKKGGDGSHLHFEVYYHGKRVDPLQFLPELVS